MVMSYNFKQPNGAPASHRSHSSMDQTFDGLTDSLIYPVTHTPLHQLIQYNNQPAWDGVNSWQNNPQDNYNDGQYQMSSFTPVGYFPNHQQDFVPFDNGKTIYHDNDKAANIARMNECAQSSGQALGHKGLHVPREQLEARLHDIINNPKQIPISEFQDKALRSNSSTLGSPTSKQDMNTLNDRAAELRARLLAKRSSTPVTPSNMGSKLSDMNRAKTVYDESPSKALDSSYPAGSPRGKAVISDTSQTLTKNTAANKSLVNSSPLKKQNASTDIDGLLAEGRAAAAAEPDKIETHNENGDDGTKNNNSERTNKVHNKATNSEETKSSPKGGHRRSLHNSSTSSSEMGEIRSDAGKPLRRFDHVEISKGKEGKEYAQPSNQSPKRTSQPSIGSTTKQSNEIQNKAPEFGKVTSSETSKTVDISKAPSSSQSSSHLHSQPPTHQTARNRDQQQTLAQEPRKEYENDRRRDSDVKERITEPRRISEYQSSGHGGYRDRADYRRDVDIRRPQASRYDVEESARAAAEYKKELEARRQQASRVAKEKADNKENDRKEIERTRPRTPELRAPTKNLDMSTTPKINQSINVNSGRNDITSSSTENPSKGSNDNIDDVRDWLEMSGYFDLAYRKKALARFRKMKALDLQRAELEREALSEIEGRSHFGRAASALPHDNIEAIASKTSISPQAIRSSISSMPPPPPPTRDVDDVGIKIKDSAHREALVSHRTGENGFRPDKRQPEPLSPQNLKRLRLDNDSGYRSYRTTEKILHVDSNGRASDNKIPPSPVTTKEEIWSNDSRIVGSGGRQMNEQRVRNKSRSRSLSPIRGRTSFYDKYVPRQRSRGPMMRRNDNSPTSPPPFSERPRNIDRRWCKNCEHYGHLTYNCYKPTRRDIKATDAPSHDYFHNSPQGSRRYEVKKEDSGDKEDFRDIPSSGSRLQHYQPNNFRGRSMVGTEGPLTSNVRFGYKPHQSNNRTYDGQPGEGSTSLDLKAGGGL